MPNNNPLRLGDVMSLSPFTVREDASAAKALELMQKHQIRHLVVLREGRMAGVVSDRDLALADHDGKDIRLKEIMAAEAYTVPPTTPLTSVVMHMARNKLGSTVVVEGEKIVGIFTTVDALNVLGELLTQA